MDLVKFMSGICLILDVLPEMKAECVDAIIKDLSRLTVKRVKTAFTCTRHIGVKSRWYILQDARHAQRAGETTEVKIYSNQNSVTLYCNGKKVGTKTEHRIFHFTVTLDEGINILLAVTDKVKDSLR